LFSGEKQVWKTGDPVKNRVVNIATPPPPQPSEATETDGDGTDNEQTDNENNTPDKPKGREKT